MTIWHENTTHPYLQVTFSYRCIYSISASFVSQNDKFYFNQVSKREALDPALYICSLRLSPNRTGHYLVICSHGDFCVSGPPTNMPDTNSKALGCSYTIRTAWRIPWLCKIMDTNLACHPPLCTHPCVLPRSIAHPKSDAELYLDCTDIQ
jgi:hypothetical protein